MVNEVARTTAMGGTAILRAAMEIQRATSFTLPTADEIDLGERTTAWASERGFHVEREGPPSWELRRGNPFVAAFSFDIRRVPARIAIEVTGEEHVSCTMRVRSAMHIATAGDRHAVDAEFGSLVAYLQGSEQIPPTPPARHSVTKWLLPAVIGFVVVWVAISRDRTPSARPRSSTAKLALFERARRATVLVYGESERRAGAWKGSAVVVMRYPKCHVAVTNAHVLRDASETSYALQQGQTRLLVTGRAPDRGETRPVRVSHVLSEGFTQRKLDLGFLVIPSTMNLEASRLATAEPAEGDWVFAVGHPEHEKWFPAEGMIRGTTTRDGAHVITHTALVSHGSSGGGLFDHRGKLLGLNTWVGAERRLLRSDEPVGIAISVKEIRGACEVSYVEVDARKGWQRAGVALARGQMVSAAAIGTWRLGTWAGSCGAAGMGGHKASSYAPELPHGCLLVKDDGPYIRIPELTYARSDGGELRFRINDKDLGNNAGSLGVVLVKWK